MAKPKYKNKRETEEGTTVYEYSDKQVQHRNREKAKRIEKLSDSIDDLRKQVKEDLKSDDIETQLKALAVALIDGTYGRVGNEKSVEERGHYGVTVWKKKHLSFRGNSVTIKYKGKSGVNQEKKIEDKKVVDVLKEVVDDKGDEDFIFDCGDPDDLTCIRSREVNQYLKPYDVTAKDLRGYHANRLMQDTLKDLRKKGKKLPDDTEERKELLEKEFKEALDIVSDEVGHEDATLKNNYLVPALEAKYLKDGTVIDKLDTKKSAIQKRTGHMSRIADQVAATYMEQLSSRNKKARVRSERQTFLTVGYKGTAHIRLRSTLYIGARSNAGMAIDVLEEEKTDLLRDSAKLANRFRNTSRDLFHGWEVDFEGTEGVFIGPMKEKIVLGYDIEIRILNKSKDEIERALTKAMKDMGRPVA